MSAVPTFAGCGMVRVMAAVPRVHLANPTKNAAEIAALLETADQHAVSLCVFPELSLTGSTCGDLFLQPALLDSALEALAMLMRLPVRAAFTVGLPLEIGGSLYNCAAVISGGHAVIVPKMYIPSFSVGQRCFAPGKRAQGSVSIPGIDRENVRLAVHPVIDLGRFRLGVEIGSDSLLPQPPSAALAMRGATVIAHLAAGSEIADSHARLHESLSAHSARCLSAYVHANAGFGESTTDMVFSGRACIYENGDLLAQNERFARDASHVIADIDVRRIAYQRRANAACFEGMQGETPIFLPAAQAKGSDRLLRPLSTLPFLPDHGQDAFLLDALNIQAQGLIRRMEHIRSRKLVLGVSGGLDSTLALLTAAYAYELAGWDKQGIVGITMPGFGTGTRTKGNAEKLMELIGCTMLTIPIGPAVTQHFADIGQSMDVHDICYENSQARERTQIIMDYANKIGALVLGTGDLSELALGWCTYNGDQMSMYNLNGTVPKTLMRSMVAYAAQLLGESIVPVARDILDTPVSPELLPGENGEIAQKTEETLGAYELHDFFLWHMMDSGASPSKLYALALAAFGDQHSSDAILHALSNFVRRFFTQQFKRSAMPDGPQVTPVSLSPRGSWHMPSDAQMQLWMDEVNALKN